MTKKLMFIERGPDEGGTRYFGRHGWGKMRGVDIFVDFSLENVVLTPINTRGVCNSSAIEIPKEHLVEFIDELKKLI